MTEPDTGSRPAFSIAEALPPREIAVLLLRTPGAGDRSSEAVKDSSTQNSSGVPKKRADNACTACEGWRQTELEGGLAD